MSSEAFELSRRAWVAVDERDLEGFLAIIHEDVEFVSLVAEAEGGTFNGHEGVRDWWESVGESLGTLRYEPRKMRDLGGEAVLTELVVSGTVGGVEVPQTMWHAVQVRDGKAAWWGSFRTEEEALRSLEAFRARAQAE
ncbi:MAG TPA: nuclear transport factor 2 family protein [Solirubrobacterales bacterium]|nr:nuclear transport factor 2 family protein [Solirubrobacterales bacterium]